MLWKNTKEITKWISNYFGIRHREAKGFAVIIVLILIHIVIIFILRLYLRTKTYRSISLDELQELELLSRNLNIPLDKKEHIDSSSILQSDIVKYIDINSTEYYELNSLSILDSMISRRIIKFRNILGGFYTKDQIDEVYGISKLASKSLKRMITINTELIRTINVNEVDKSILYRHPYISKMHANSILRYRMNHGKIKDLDDIVNLLSLSKKESMRLDQYLKF